MSLESLESVKPIGIACDHAGFELKLPIIEALRGSGYEVLDFGCDNVDSVDYPDYAEKLAGAIEAGNCGFGILLCGSGIGMSIAANRHVGVRAALCCDEAVAELARLHNDANVLVLGARLLNRERACVIVSKFLGTNFSGIERHSRRLAKLNHDGGGE